jgi:hypothetical protein
LTNLWYKFENGYFYGKNSKILTRTIISGLIKKNFITVKLKIYLEKNITDKHQKKNFRSWITTKAGLKHKCVWASERAKEREREGFLYVGFYLLPIAPPRPSATDLDSCDRSFLHPIVLLSKFVKICHCASASLRDRDPTFFPYDLCYVTHTLRFAPFRSKPSCLNHCYVQ